MPRALARPRAALAVALAVLAVACAPDPHRGEARLQVAWQLEEPLVAGTPLRLEVHVSEIDWTPRNGLQVRVSARSATDSVPDAHAAGRGAGLYAVEGFTLPTPGTWTLTARATRPDGRWTERDRVVEVEGSPPVSP